VREFNAPARMANHHSLTIRILWNSFMRSDRRMFATEMRSSMFQQQESGMARSKAAVATAANNSDNGVLSRRNLLLAGKSLMTATALNAVDPAQLAQAQQPQQPPAPSGRKPNILVIFGDDIGQSNISAYTTQSQ
jgi:hypothetical protein